jgi:2-polyprenyl-3-methyl-5-hydroxy-6-metoxy-1,4-benzoquinol methylase
MNWRRRSCFLVALLIALVSPQLTYGQQAADAAVYDQFRAWSASRPAETGGQVRTQLPDLLSEYRKTLAADGVTTGEIDRRLEVIRRSARQAEVERWNKILTSAKPTFNVQPNAFLVRAIKDVRAGTALDVGMGQGRNAIYLAQHGWTVTGFDPAEEAVAAAQQQARQLGVEIKTSITGNEDFDFGKDRWDLIVLSYVGFRNTIPKMLESLKPGGRIVLEAFHRDSLKNGAIGAGVVFDSNELLKVFDAFRIVHYEDAQDKSDFGTGTTNRVVRLVAEKR